jgi:hypothetical protein
MMEGGSPKKSGLPYSHLKEKPNLLQCLSVGGFDGKLNANVVGLSVCPIRQIQELRLQGKLWQFFENEYKA